MNLSIIGSGYVGLVTGACFASLGFKVCILDNDKSKIRKLKRGKIPFYEPGLQELVNDGVKKNILSFTSSFDECMEFSDIYFLCVGTPQSVSGKPNLVFLNTIRNQLRAYFKKINSETRKVIFIKSTVPPGTANKMASFFKRNNIENILVASNPEFLREGNAVDDFFNPDRVIVGTNSIFVREIGKKLYLKIIKQKNIFFTNPQSSELIKYSSNAFLATKISFINELSRLSESVNANIGDISKGMGLDKRIGDAFLNAGIGFGGSCFPKDLAGLQNSYKENNIKSPIIDAVLKINDSQYKYFLEKILKFYSKQKLKRKTIAIWGTAFKPNTDDIRESLGIKIINFLAPKVNKIIAFDNFAANNSKLSLKAHQNVIFMNSLESTLKNSDFLIISTDDESFKKMNPELFKYLSDQTIFDGRNILDKEILESIGLNYFGIGR